MKLPAKIFVNYAKDEGLPTIGVFRTERINDGPNQQYIRRDVVIEAMEMVEIDVIERYGDCVECDFEEILNSVIEDANKEEVKK